MLSSRSIFSADTPYQYEAILPETISSRTHQTILNELYLPLFLLPYTSHPGKIPALHDSHRSVLVFLKVLSLPTTPALFDTRIHCQVRAEWLHALNTMAS